MEPRSRAFHPINRVRSHYACVRFIWICRILAPQALWPSRTPSVRSRETAMHRRALRYVVAGLVVLAQTLPPALTLAHHSTPVPEAAGCTAGSSGIGDPYFPLLGNSGYDIQHYTLDLDLDVAGGA